MSETNVPNRYHNLPSEMLADQLGDLDARAKALASEIDAIKAELRQRGIAEAVGENFCVTVTEQIQGRLDTAAVKLHLGAAYARFEKPVISTVIRIKAANRAALQLAA